MLLLIDICLSLILVNFSSRYEGRKNGSEGKEPPRTTEGHLPFSEGTEGFTNAQSNLHNIPCICGATTACDCYTGEKLSTVEEKLTASLSCSTTFNTEFPIKVEVSEVCNKSQYGSIKQGDEGNPCDSKPDGKPGGFHSKSVNTALTEQAKYIQQGTGNSNESQPIPQPGKDLSIPDLLKVKGPLPIHPSKANKKMHARCSTCQQWFPKGPFVQHKRLAHPEMRIFKCKICSLTFERIGRLRLHIMKIHRRDTTNDAIEIRGDSNTKGDLHDTGQNFPQNSVKTERGERLEPTKHGSVDILKEEVKICDTYPNNTMALHPTSQPALPVGTSLQQAALIFVASQPYPASSYPNATGFGVGVQQTLGGSVAHTAATTHTLHGNRNPENVTQPLGVQTSASMKKTISKKIKGKQKCPHCDQYFNVGAPYTEHKIQAHPEFRIHKCPLCSASYEFVGRLRNHILIAHKSPQNGKRKNKELKVLPKELNEYFNAYSYNSSAPPASPPALREGSCSQQQAPQAQLIVPASQPYPALAYPNSTELGGGVQETLTDPYLNAADTKSTQEDNSNPTKSLEKTMSETRKENPENRTQPLGVQMSASKKNTMSKRKKRKQKCPQCNQSFRIGTAYTKHKYLAHPELRIHTCPVCAETYQYLGRLTNHIKRDHLFCQVCKTVFANVDEFKQHQEETSHMNAPNLSSAKSSIKPGRHKCRICQQRFRGQLRLERHKMFKHPELRKFSCCICPLKYERAGRLKIHLRKVHNICVNEKELKTPPNKSSHLKPAQNRDGISHLSASDFSPIKKKRGRPKTIWQCKICGINFTSNLEKRRHMSAEHPKSGVKEISCKFCDETFTYVRKFREHLQTVHCFCRNCKEGFDTEQDLQKHKCKPGMKKFVWEYGMNLCT